MEKQITSIHPYNLDLYNTIRLKTIEVDIGGVPVGGNNPIRVQSMTTTDTMDTEATIQQSLRMVESGCEYVRITAPSKKEAENLKNIREGLRKLGCNVPLVADIHYTPNAAEIAARIVEKVRVNPGNYADKKRFDIIEYTDEQYQAEIQRIYDRFSPLVKICKEHGTAMRIGTNHGSLSDRILSRYGDTPLGMVESALEFVRICEDHNFDQLVISMKASNPQVMVQAYRLLVQKMLQNGKCYPLHLGVTEAGEGEDGRIKSAVGISTLLMDGIGDTVRVSLTEDPEFESPVAGFLVDFAVNQANDVPIARRGTEPVSAVDPFAFKRRETLDLVNVGSENVPRVVADFSAKPLTYDDLSSVGYQYSEELDKYNFTETAPDYVYLGRNVPAFDLPGALKPLYDYSQWKMFRQPQRRYPYFEDFDQFLMADLRHYELNFVSICQDDLEKINASKDLISKVAFVIEGKGREAFHTWRLMVNSLEQNGHKNPVIFRTDYPQDFSFYREEEIKEKFRVEEEGKVQMYLASQLSSSVVDGTIDGVWVSPGNERSNRTAFGILQAGRLRTTKTEYISCPSCGRTLFDLQETTAKIRHRTEHLKGVKIGIMGCIVNGPGEMADADYGYVGVGPDKIALYRGQEVVEKAVKTEFAVDKLIDLIKEDGNWVEPVA